MIGILPAGGQASRICGLPKYLLPIGDTYLLKRHIDMMKPLAPYIIPIATSDLNRRLLMKYSSVINVLTAKNHRTMTEALINCSENMSKSESVGQSVLFGMPDTYIEDDQCYAKLAAALADCDVAVGVFETRRNQRDKLGMVQVHHETAKVIHVVDKPAQDTALTQAWGTLAWKPAFWQYLKPDMPHVGYALMPAIEAGLDVRAVVMDGGFWDCGTFDEYAELIRTIT